MPALRAHGKLWQSQYASGTHRVPEECAEGVVVLTPEGNQHDTMAILLSEALMETSRDSNWLLSQLKADRLHGCCCPYASPKPQPQTLGAFPRGNPLQLTGVTQILHHHSHSSPSHAHPHTHTHTRVSGGFNPLPDPQTLSLPVHRTRHY